MGPLHLPRHRRPLFLIHPLRQRLFLINPLLLALLALVVVLTLGVLASCSSTPTTGTSSSGLQTFDLVYSSAVQTETLILNETNTALTAKAISPAQAQKVLSVTDSIKTLLDASNAAAQAGNSGLATADVSQATAAIAVISICLTQKPLTPATFTTCTATLSPPQVQP